MYQKSIRTIECFKSVFKNIINGILREKIDSFINLK